MPVPQAEPFLPSGGPAQPTDETTAEERDVDASGLGDVRLELRCRVLDEGAWWPAVSLVAEVKAPTADPDRGLGTGEWDAGGGLILAKRFDRLQLQLDARAVAVGEPPDVELEPVVFSGQLSLGWSISLDIDVTLTPFVFASAQTRTSRTVDPPVEAGAGAWFGLGRWVVGLSAAAGLTDGSPDFALGLSLSLTWSEVGPAE